MHNTDKKKTTTKSKNFYLRTLSAVLLLPPVLYSINFGGFFYFVLLFIILILAGYEWNYICGKYSFGIDAMLSITFIALIMVCFIMNRISYAIILLAIGTYITYLTAKLRGKSYKGVVIPNYLNRPKWFTIGFIYLALGFGSLGYLGNLDNYQFTVLWVFLSVAACDTGAYIAGSLIGGKKILPSVSPKKSWSGFFGGAFASMLVSYIFAAYLSSTNEIMVIALGFFIAIVGHVGDLLESAFKRYVGVKDTSNLIPGHGGILDRIDALILVAMFIALIGLFINKSPLFLPF